MALSEDVEISGKFPVGITAAVGELSSIFEKQALETLDKYGITDPDPEEWYSAQKYANALDDILDKVGESTMVVIGQHLAQVSEWGDVDNIVEALQAMEEVNQGAHRNHDPDEIGHFYVEETGANEVLVTISGNYPYPYQLMKGATKETAKMFSPDDANVHLEDLSDDPEYGDADDNVIRVSW